MKRTIVVGIFILGIIGSIVIFEAMQRNTSSDPVLSPPDEVSPQSTFFRNPRYIQRRGDQPGYEVIAENNLFRPLGWKKEVKPPRESNLTVTPEPMVSAPRPNPQIYTLILTGIAKHGSHWVAVVEDRKNDVGVFLQCGNMIKDAQVRHIMPEHITLARGGITVRLALGESIEYEADGRLRFDAAAASKITKHPDKTSASLETRMDSADVVERNPCLRK